MFIKFSKSARKHRIAKGRALEVMAATEGTEALREDGATEVRWVGNDARGLELEVIGILKTDRNTGDTMLLVIHVMPTSFPTKEEE